MGLKEVIFKLLIEDCIYNNRDWGEEQIEELIDHGLIQDCAGLTIVETEPEMRKNENNVLEEVVEHKVGISSVCLSSMEQKQSS